MPDEELTPVEDWRPLEELDVLDEVDEVDEEDDDDVWSLVEEVDDEDVPGIVAALIALNNPRPAKAATAVPAVRRLSIRRAASRARILESGCGVLSMSKRVSAATEPDLGAGLELAESLSARPVQNVRNPNPVRARSAQSVRNQVREAPGARRAHKSKFVRCLGAPP